ncbi:hypothetical protein BH10PSE13_BH10PSE13_04320 [soil metagenome]
MVIYIKTMVTAVAVTMISTPVFAQSTPAADPSSISLTSEGSASYQFYDRGSNSNNTQNSTMVNPNAESWFGNDSTVATTNLSSYVTGVATDTSITVGEGSVHSGVNLSGNSFQNGAGVFSLNINTGTGASQNAGVSINTAP